MASDAMAAARALGPALRERSAEIDEIHRLPADIVERLHETGLFRFWVPAAYGGAELPVVEGLEVVEEVARHDTGVAWCVFIANSTALAAGLLEPRWAKELFGDPRAVAGGFAAPVGRARVVDGGLRVSGRWQWGSGTQHCSAIGGGVLVVDEHGAPSPLPDGTIAPFVFFDLADVVHHDTWHVLGVRGSGSTDYQVDDAFVPEGRWIDATAPVAHVDGPLYRLSFFGVLGAGIAATAIGVAERAREELHDLALAKSPQSSGRSLAERPATQADLARAEATIRSARLFLHDAFGDAWATAAAGDEVTVEQRRLLRLAVTDATQRCCDVVSRLHRVAGGEAVYQRSPLERLFRDANVVSQHAMAAERTYELAGRLAFGFDTDVRTL